MEGRGWISVASINSFVSRLWVERSDFQGPFFLLFLFLTPSPANPLKYQLERTSSTRVAFSLSLSLSLLARSMLFLRLPFAADGRIDRSDCTKRVFHAAKSSRSIVAGTEQKKAGRLTERK